MLPLNTSETLSFRHASRQLDHQALDVSLYRRRVLIAVFGTTVHDVIPPRITNRPNLLQNRIVKLLTRLFSLSRSHLFDASIHAHLQLVDDLFPFQMTDR